MILQNQSNYVATINRETIIGKYSCEGKIDKVPFNMDNYLVEIKTAMSTKEFSVQVDFLNNEITGDTVQFGEWYELELEQCLVILSIIAEQGKLFRDYRYLNLNR